MAWDRHCHRIRGASAGHGAYGSGLADALGDLAVGFRVAEWNRLQIFPHTPLECRGSNIERERRIEVLTAHVLEQRTDPRTQPAVVRLTHSEGKLALQPFDQLAIGSGKLDRANSALGGCNQ